MKLHRRNRGGVTIADAFVIVAMLALVATIAAPNWGDAKHRADTAGVKDDFRQIATALEAYKVDQMAYPRCGAQGHCLNLSPTTNVPILERLTTPVAYIGGLPPFYDRHDAQWIAKGVNFSTVTAVPDRSPVYFYTARHTTSSSRWGFGSPDPIWYLFESAGPDKTRHYVTEAMDHTSEGSTQGLSLFSSLIYDPTNGLVSSGSIWHAGGTISGAGSDLGRMVQEDGSARVSGWETYAERPSQ